MLEKTITDDAKLGIKKAAIKLTLPSIEIDVYGSNDAVINLETKERLVDIVENIIDKNLT